jgi:hypothetical protein
MKDQLVLRHPYDRYGNPNLQSGPFLFTYGGNRLCAGAAASAVGVILQVWFSQSVNSYCLHWFYGFESPSVFPAPCVTLRNK